MSRAILAQAEALVQRLTFGEKLRLVKRLEQQTLKRRWNQLLNTVDQRRKGRRFTMAQIQREIDAVRRARRPHGSSSRG